MKELAEALLEVAEALYEQAYQCGLEPKIRNSAAAIDKLRKLIKSYEKENP